MQSQYKLCFLDLETTGYDPLKRSGDVLRPWHEIIEIGAAVADFDSLEIEKEFEVKINPQHPERCMSGLVNDYQNRFQKGEWDNSVSMLQAVVTFLDFCKGCKSKLVLAGQNISFDWSFMNVALILARVHENYSSDIFHYAKIDIRSMAVQELLGARPYNPDDYSLRFNKLSERLGISQESYPHKALNGARQAHLVYKKLREYQYFLSTIFLTI